VSLDVSCEVGNGVEEFKTNVNLGLQTGLFRPSFPCSSSVRPLRYGDCGEISDRPDDLPWKQRVNFSAGSNLELQGRRSSLPHLVALRPQRSSVTTAELNIFFNRIFHSFALPYKLGAPATADAAVPSLRHWRSNICNLSSSLSRCHTSRQTAWRTVLR